MRVTIRGYAKLLDMDPIAVETFDGEPEDVGTKVSEFASQHKAFTIDTIIYTEEERALINSK
jgi:hypothetical protein